MYRDKKTIRQYLITYVVVMLIPLIICASYYVRLLKMIRDDDIQEKEVELQHTAVLVDKIIDEFSYVIDSLVVNEEVLSFKKIENSFRYPNSYKIIELRDDLLDLYQINQSIFGFYLFFDNSKIVISKNMAYTYEDFYNLHLREVKFNDFEEWQKNLLIFDNVDSVLSLERYIYQAEEIDLITYSRPLFDYNGKICGVIEILLEESDLELVMPSRTEDSIQYIKDVSGDIIYNKSNNEIDSSVLEEELTKGNRNQEVVINNVTYIVVEWISELSGLTFYHIEPKNSVISRQLTTSMILTCLVGVAITVGVFLSYFMSVRTAKSINTILKESMEEFENQEKPLLLSNLPKVVHELNNKNTALSIALEKQVPYIRSTFFNKLIYGNFISKEERENISHYVDINAERKLFWIVIIRFVIDLEEGDKETQTLINTCILSSIETIEKNFPDTLYTNEGGEQVSFLMSISAEKSETLRADAEKQFTKMKEMMPVRIAEKMVIYCGNEVRNLTDLYESYNNASYICNSGLWQARQSINWYEGSENILVSYPTTDFSVKLTHYVTTGDREGLHEALGDIMKTYFIENNLSTYLQHMILNELQIILFRILKRIAVDEMNYSKLEENHNAPLITQITSTINLYREVCEYVASQKTQLDIPAIIPSVVSYIDLNYGDSNISLASVSSIFQLNESYLSSVFKQELGVKFSNYLEELRINRAKELLKTTNLLVGDIGEQTGYYSTNSFCRAFKRKTGISASEYRKQK